jgi:uncharacterized protein YhaN
MTKSSPRKLAYQAEYQKQPEEIEKRVARNRARRHAIAEGRAHKGDGKDVDHVRPLDAGGSKSDANTRVVDASENRGWRSRRDFLYGKNRQR